MKRSMWAVTSAVLLCVVAVFVAKGRHRKAATGESTTDEAGGTEWVQGIGYVEPASEIRRLVFKTHGVVAECRVSLGQQVRRGEVLMALRNEGEKAAVATAEQELAVSKAEREKIQAGVNPAEIVAAEGRRTQLEAELAFAKREADRQRKLHQQNLVSSADYELAETDERRKTSALASAEAEVTRLRQFVREEDLKLADAKVRLAEARLAAANAALEDTLLRAPFDGTVFEILRREGEGIAAFTAEPTLIFADASRLRVRAEVDENFVRTIYKGQRAEVIAQAFFSGWHPGKVAEIKNIMGKKTVFSRAADERKDLDVLQVLIDLEPGYSAPLGLEVDVRLQKMGGDFRSGGG